MAEVDAGVEDADGDAAPSALGFFFTKSTAPVSKDGLYGFFAGVFLSGAAYPLALLPLPLAAFVVSAAGVGSSSRISSLRSTPYTLESLVAAAMAASALPVGTVARTYPSLLSERPTEAPLTDSISSVT